MLKYFVKGKEETYMSKYGFNADKVMNNILGKVHGVEYKLFVQVFTMTFVLGFFAYGYAFSCFTPAHDGIMTITHDQGWQTSIGRGLMQVYVRLRGEIDAPWLIGILALFYTSISVYLTVKALGIEDEGWKIFVISSLYVLNIAYALSTTVFMYLWDIYAMALLLSVLAFYVFVNVKNRFCAILTSAIILSLSMGLYQSYFAVMVGLFILLFIILTIKEDNSLKQQFMLALEEIIVLAIGAVLYGITLKIIQIITNVEPANNYNSVSNISNLSVKSIISTIPSCYKEFFVFFFKAQPYANRVFSLVNVVLLIGAIIAYVLVLRKMESNIDRILLCVAIILFPLGVNCIYVLSGGMIHYLMVFSYQIFYILMLLPWLYSGFEFSKTVGRLPKRVITLFVLILSFVVVRFSNGLLYYQKLVGEGTRASVTNVLYDIERNPDFNPDRMRIIMVGRPGEALSQDYEMRNLYGRYNGISGSTITYDSVFGDYMHYILGRNYDFDYSEEDIAEVMKTEEYKAMASYPEEGYIGVINDYLVIKFDAE